MGDDSNNSDTYDDLLIQAAKDGDVPRVQDLFSIMEEAGVNVNCKDHRRGETPLHFACSNGHFEVAKLLIENGADLSAKTNGGDTPFLVACDYEAGGHLGHLGIIQLLIENGADVLHAKTPFGETPLHKASENGYYDIVKLLLQEDGADINVKSVLGWTPLYVACDDGQLEIVQLLLSHGASVTEETTDNGETPLHASCRRNYPEIVWLLVRQNPWLVVEPSDSS